MDDPIAVGDVIKEAGQAYRPMLRRSVEQHAMEGGTTVAPHVRVANEVQEVCLPYF
jgi:hypothetical protein